MKNIIQLSMIAMVAVFWASVIRVNAQACPEFSSPNASGQCACNAGYRPTDAGCSELTDAYCSGENGPHAIYNPTLKGCDCEAGYIFDDSQGICVTNNEYCSAKYVHASYNAERSLCQCDKGYMLSPEKTCVIEAVSPTPSTSGTTLPSETATPSLRPSAFPVLINDFSEAVPSVSPDISVLPSTPAPAAITEPVELAPVAQKESFWNWLLGLLFFWRD